MWSYQGPGVIQPDPVEATYVGQKITLVCDRCGGIDYCKLNGAYIEKHECENLNTNQLLRRIAVALEAIAGKL